MRTSFNAPSEVERQFERIGFKLRLAPEVRTTMSSVTTQWGVDWSERYIARDLLQNFFDANKRSPKDILIDTHSRGALTDVVVRAPASFNLERLFFLGSQKGPDDIGHFGEGFGCGSFGTTVI